jgi:hypothetical protein
VTMLNALDGGYCLVGPSESAPPPLVEKGAAGVTLSVATDFLLVTTFGNWQEVEVDIIERPTPFRQSGPSGWEVERSAVWRTTGSVRLTDLELEPQGTDSLRLPPGSYLVQLFARSRNFVAANVQLFDEKSGPTEQHRVYVSPAG